VPLVSSQHAEIRLGKHCYLLQALSKAAYTFVKTGDGDERAYVHQAGEPPVIELAHGDVVRFGGGRDGTANGGYDKFCYRLFAPFSNARGSAGGRGAKRQQAERPAGGGPAEAAAAADLATTAARHGELLRSVADPTRRKQLAKALHASAVGTYEVERALAMGDEEGAVAAMARAETASHRLRQDRLHQGRSERKRAAHRGDGRGKPAAERKPAAPKPRGIHKKARGPGTGSATARSRKHNRQQADGQRRGGGGRGGGGRGGSGGERSVRIEPDGRVPMGRAPGGRHGGRGRR
jgi:uncharacterized membrane protein YgcG